MTVSILPIMRDYLIRYQQTAIKQTGHRPMAVIGHPLEEALVLPGCAKKGFQYWQPIAWPKQNAPLGAYASKMHPSIIDYVSLCQFLEIRFRLPITPSNKPLSIVYQRVFETFRNTEAMKPATIFEEAFLLSAFQKEASADFPFAQTCDGQAPLLLMLSANTGKAYIDPVSSAHANIPLHVCLDRLLPKLQFCNESEKER